MASIQKTMGVFYIWVVDQQESTAVIAAVGTTTAAMKGCGHCRAEQNSSGILYKPRVSSVQIKVLIDTLSRG